MYSCTSKASKFSISPGVGSICTSPALTGTTVQNMRTLVPVKQVNLHWQHLHVFCVGSICTSPALPRRSFCKYAYYCTSKSKEIEYLARRWSICRSPALPRRSFWKKKGGGGGEARRVQPPQRQYLYFCTSKAVFVLLY